MSKKKVEEALSNFKEANPNFDWNKAMEEFQEGSYGKFIEEFKPLQQEVIKKHFWDNENNKPTFNFLSLDDRIKLGQELVKLIHNKFNSLKKKINKENNRRFPETVSGTGSPNDPNFH